LLIEAGAKAAWSTDRGLPIVVGIMEALRVSGITLPSPSVIERAGIAGRARARQRTYEALLASLPAESLAKLDATLVVDPKTSLTPLAWLREIATAPTPDNVRGLLDRLACVRDIGLPVTIGDAIHADRLRQFVREGRASSAQLIGRYTPSRRRATLAAMILDLESRLTDAALDMADRIIGGSFTRGNNKQKRSYAETTRDVGRIMRLFDQTVGALAEAQESGMEGFAAVDAAVGWDKLLRARGQARQIADLTEENPLVRAADQWSRLRKFAPLLLEAIDFKAGRGSASTIAALNTLREMNRSGSRDVPPDAPMPFRKEWRTLVKAGGGKIISLASQAGSVALDQHVAYCSSKFGVIGLTKCLASEWAGRGVTVNSISPTVVLTDLGKNAWDGPKGEALKKLIPTGRFALPEEIAAAAVFLASGGADMINGADLLIDGGYTIR
jgi:NAD(P)-dependent dehydrogenase (short-subunit alcohol dehydrogenase family)